MRTVEFRWRLTLRARHYRRSGAWRSSRTGRTLEQKKKRNDIETTTIASTRVVNWLIQETSVHANPLAEGESNDFPLEKTGATYPVIAWRRRRIIHGLRMKKKKRKPVSLKCAGKEQRIRWGAYRGRIRTLWPLRPWTTRSSKSHGR